MAPRTFAARLDRLQEQLAAQLKKPIASVFLAFDPDRTADDYEVLAEQTRDEMVANEEIGPNQRNRVMFIRWLTSEENAERVAAGVSGPVPTSSNERMSPVETSPTEKSAPDLQANRHEADDSSETSGRSGSTAVWMCRIWASSD